MIELLLIFAPLTYIILWFYSLFTFIIPVLSVNIYNISSLLSLNLIQITYIVAFWFVGLPLLIWAFVLFFGMLFAIID